MFWKPADGSGPGEQLAKSEHELEALSSMSWSPDGKVLAFVEPHVQTGQDIWLLPLDGDRRPRPFLQSASNEGAPQFSPDGHWLAFVSDESGRAEVYVQPFPGPGGKWQVSEGGAEPVWNPKGREMFYRNGDRMMAVEVTTKPAFAAGKPRMLFEGGYLVSTWSTVTNYDVSADGLRFLMTKDSEQATATTHINVVQNWFEELKRKVPVTTHR